MKYGYIWGDIATAGAVRHVSDSKIESQHLLAKTINRNLDRLNDPELLDKWPIEYALRICEESILVSFTFNLEEK